MDSLSSRARASLSTSFSFRLPLVSFLFQAITSTSLLSVLWRKKKERERRVFDFLVFYALNNDDVPHRCVNVAGV